MTDNACEAQRAASESLVHQTLDRIDTVEAKAREHEQAVLKKLDEVSAQVKKLDEAAAKSRTGEMALAVAVVIFGLGLWFVGTW